MRRVLLAFLLVLLAGCSGSEPSNPGSDAATFSVAPEPPPTFSYDGLRLATLNTEFLFDGLDDEGQATFPHKGDTELARLHRAEVARVIRMLDADVLMLQEVENEYVLEQLVEEDLSEFGYEVHFVEGRDSFTGQDVGLLARVPVDTLGRTDDRVEVEGSDRLYGVSKNLWARVDLDGVPTTLIGLHFLARPDDIERKPRREAQAEVIRQLVAREQAMGRSVVVMGDFNDFDETTRDLIGSQPITDVLATIKSAGPESNDDLHNVMAEVPQRERFTAHWDRDDGDDVDTDELSALDHVLLSPRLYRALREVTFVQAHEPLEVTDHFPIVVTLELEPPTVGVAP